MIISLDAGTIGIVTAGLLDVVVSVSVVVGAAWTMSRLFKRHPAAVRHRIWVGAVVLVFAQLVMSAVTVGGAIVADVPPNAQLLLPPIAENSERIPIVLGIVVAGALIRLALVLREVVKLRHLQAALTSFVAPASVLAALPRIGRTGNVRILSGADDTAPSCWGFARPTIVLPATAEFWPSHQLEMVLQHECEHLRRHDPLLQLVAELASAVLWFHPGVQFIVRQLSTECELACDRAVVKFGADPEAYAESLVQLARAHRTSWATANGVVGTSRLAVRIDALLEPDNRIVPSLSRLRTVASILVAAMCMWSLFTPPIIGVSAGGNWAASSAFEPAGSTPASFRSHPEPQH